MLMKLNQERIYIMANMVYVKALSSFVGVEGSFMKGRVYQINFGRAKDLIRRGFVESYDGDLIPKKEPRMRIEDAYKLMMAQNEAAEELLLNTESAPDDSPDADFLEVIEED